MKKIALIPLLAVSQIWLHGQNVSNDKTPYLLDPFVILGNDSNGYAATNSISGTRINTAIKDIPVPISIVTEEFIRDFAYSKVEDAVTVDATVTKRERNEGQFAENFNIRGFQSSLILRNRVPYRGFTDASLIDRIEIVKGPAAVLYGLSDPGGLVNIITKKPIAIKRHNLEFRVGSEDFRRVQWDTTGPIDEAQRFLYRLTGSYEEADSQRAGGWHRQTFITPAFTFKVSERTKIDFEYSFQNREHAFQRPRNPFDVTGRAWEPVDQDYSTITDRDHTTNEGNTWQVDLTQSFSDKVFMRATASKTSRDTDMFNLVGCCADAQNVFTGISNVEILAGDNTNYYLDLTAADIEIGATTHTLLIGAQKDDNSSATQIYRMTPGVASVIGRLPVTPFNVLTGEGRNARGEVVMNVTREEAQSLPLANVGKPGFTAGSSTGSSRSTSFFLMDQVKMFENRLNILAGLRRDKLEQQGQTDVSNTSTQAGFTFELVEGINLYSLYSESFVPNSDTLDTRTNPATLFTFEPSLGTGMDIGFKFDILRNTLSGTIAYFTIDRTNIKQTNPLPASQIPADEPLVFLSGLERSKGVEVQLVYTPTSSTQFMLSYAHTDAEVVETLIPGAKGLQLEQSSPHAVSITGRHSFASGIFVGGTWLYRAGPIPQFTLVGREWAHQKGYSRGDAFVGYRRKVGEINHTFRLNVSNITDGTFYDRTETFALGRQFFLTWGIDL